MRTTTAQQRCERGAEEEREYCQQRGAEEEREYCLWLTLSHCECVVAVPCFSLGSRTLERVHIGTYATLVSGTTWQRIHRERALYLRSRRLRRTPLASWKRPRGISPSHVSLFLWYLMHPRKVRRRMWILNRVASNLLCAGLRRQDCLPWCPRAYTPPPVHDTPAFSCIPSSRSTILSMLVS